MKEETITIDELKNIIMECKENIDIGINPIVFEKMSVEYEFKEFKKHNRLDCTLWALIFPFDFKIYLDKENYIIKKPFTEERKNQKVVGKKLLL